MGTDSYVVDVGEQRSIWKRPDEMRRGGLGTSKPKGAGFLEAKPGGKPMSEYKVEYESPYGPKGGGKKPASIKSPFSHRRTPLSEVGSGSRKQKESMRRAKRKRKLSDKQIERITGAKGGVDPKTGQPREGAMDWAAGYLRDG